MNIDTQEVARRICALREDMGISLPEMAQATGRSIEEYIAQESGVRDLTFTFLSKAADRLGVDVVELLTGEAPHLNGYTLTRADEGLSIKRRAQFEYLHKAPYLHGRMCEPFVVTAPYSADEQDKPIHLSNHAGQEFDYVISGRLRFQHDEHIEELGPGDSVLYDSGRPHGMIAIDGQPCVFLALVMKPRGQQIL